MIAEKDNEGCYYGFPVLPAEKFDGPNGLKLAYHYPGVSTDPDNINRDTATEDESNLIGYIKKIYSGKDINLPLK
jgi:hypothetical protein